MKKYILSIISATMLLSLQSCGDFLSVTPRDIKVVYTVEDYRDIMASFMYQLTATESRSNILSLGTSTDCYPVFDVSKMMSIYSDEVELSKSSDYFNSDAGVYTSTGLDLMTWMSTGDSADIWEQNYGFTGPINLIINDIVDAEGDDEDLRNYVKGEALVWRAYTYYKLLQYFSSYKDNSLGIPIHLESVENIAEAMPARKTQTECFEIILEDCNEVLLLLEVTPTNDWNFGYRKDFVYSMMASIYAWKALSGAAESDDWTNAYNYAELSIGTRKLTNDPDEIEEIFDFTMGTIGESDELTIRIIEDGGSTVKFFNFIDTYNESTFLDQSSVLSSYNKYSDDDIRKGVYFTSTGVALAKYVSLGEIGGIIIPFRLAEMVLIQAEAKARLGAEAEARAILDEFRAARYDGATVEDSAEVLDDILLERKLEFFCELDHRWLDMKRLGVSVTRVISGTYYTLDADDFRYTFPIPDSELSANQNIVQAPGWEDILVL